MKLASWNINSINLRKDTVLEWIYRYARQAKLVDGASEVHQMIINRFFNKDKSDFWHWGVGNDI